MGLNYWKQRRKEFRKNTHNRCFICRDNRNLDTHHKRYKNKKGESILFNERHQDLRLLCRTCHFKIHKYNLKEYLTNNIIKRRELRDFLKKLG